MSVTGRYGIKGQTSLASSMLLNKFFISRLHYFGLIIIMLIRSMTTSKRSVTVKVAVAVRHL